MAVGVEVFLAASFPDEGCLVLLAAETSQAAQGSVHGALWKPTEREV